jgi:hypothetical protein
MAMNMGYCRHENTAKALHECIQENFIGQNVRDAEWAVRLYELCEQVVNRLDISDIKLHVDELILEELGE